MMRGCDSEPGFRIRIRTRTQNQREVKKADLPMAQHPAFNQLLRIGQLNLQNVNLLDLRVQSAGNFNFLSFETVH
jgi:hypothetical protein